MKKFEYTITDEIGIHARPAGLLVKMAGQYKADMKVECNGKTADAKKLMALMALGVKKGDIVSVSVEAEDEKEAAASMETFFRENL